MSVDERGTFLGRWQREFRVSGIKEHLMLLGFVMATYADADGRNIRPGHDALASHVNKKDAGTVGRSVKALLTSGWIEQTGKAVSPGRNGGDARAAEYRLAIPSNDPASDAGSFANHPASGVNDPASKVNDPASGRRPTNASPPMHPTNAPCFYCTPGDACSHCGATATDEKACGCPIWQTCTDCRPVPKVESKQPEWKQIQRVENENKAEGLNTLGYIESEDQEPGVDRYRGRRA